MLRDSDRRRALARLAAGALALVAVAVVAAHSGLLGPGALSASAGGPAGALVFVALAALSTVVLLPGHVTATVAGALFGLAAGVPLMLAATVLGAALAFCLSRRLGSATVARLLGERGERLRASVAERGFTAVLIARLLPGIPAGPLNYAGGLTGMRLSAFCAAVALGAAPKTLAYVALGGALSDPFSARGLAAAGLYAAAALGGLLLARRHVPAALAAAR